MASQRYTTTLTVFNFHSHYISICSHIEAVTKVKKDLIHKAKVKKQYAKVKAQEEKERATPKGPQASAGELASGEDGDQSHGDAGDSENAGKGNDGGAIHPTRHLMLKDEEAAQAGAAESDRAGVSDGQRRRTRRPGYYDKQLEKAEQKRTEAEERAREVQRRREEREKRLAERERYKKAWAKTRGKDGKKKLGRESTLLLDKVKKMMAER